MATSGTNTWNLNVAQIIEKAAKRVRKRDEGPLSGQEAADGRESLNLVLTDMINRGAPLSTLELKTISLVDGTASYNIDADIVDLFHGVYSKLENSEYTDTELERISLSDYNRIANKNVKGRPSAFAVDRGQSQITIYTYPTPDNSTDALRFWCITRIEDVTAAAQDVDLSFRYTPALISGTAYYMGLERDDIDLVKLNTLKQIYDTELDLAMGEDRDRSSIYLTP
jgi:hypothetical protein